MRIVDIKNYERVEKLGKGIVIGENFVFVDPERCLSEKDVKMLDFFKIPFSSAKPQIISCLGREEVELLGGIAVVRGTKLPEPGIPSITVASMLYREGDTAHLQIIWIGKANSEVTLEVKVGSQKPNEVPVILDEYGMAEHRIASLSQGDYTVNIKGTKAFTFFKVAPHELAAFDAWLTNQELREDNYLDFAVHFSTHGVAFTGKVVAQLQSNGQSVGDPVVITANKVGVAKGKIKLQGKGELTINFQVQNDPGKTASVLVKGAKEEARKPFQINKLGEVAEVSTMKLEGGMDIRGLSYRKTGEINETPVQIYRVIDGMTDIFVKEKCKVVKLVMINLATGASQEYEYKAGDIPEVIISEPISKPGVVLYLAAILEDGRCWEGESTKIYPEKSRLKITPPEKPEPGQEIEVGFDLTSLERIPDGIPVGVVIRDSRLTAIDPGTALAVSLKTNIESFASMGKIGYSKDSLSEIAPRPFYIEESFGGFRGDVGLTQIGRSLGSQQILASTDDKVIKYLAEGGEPTRLKSIKSAKSIAVAELELEIDFSQLPVIRQTDKVPEVVFAGRIYLKDGKGSLKVKLPQGAANYVVEAVAVVDQDWQSASTSFLATKEVIGELDLPEFVHLGDQAEGKLTVTCQSRQFTVEVTQDGKPVILKKKDGTEIPVGVVFEDKQMEIFFSVQPGKIRAMIRDMRNDKTDVLEKTVYEPGKLSYKVCLTQLLQPGKVITLDDFPGATEIRVQPGLERSANRLAQSTVDYPHGCCEQTATGILAAVSMFFGGNGNKDKAEEYILAGIKRQENMWLPGKGFKMYPERENTVDTHYGPQAALRLLSLKDLEDFDGISPALAKAVKQGLEMAYDTCKAYGLEIIPSIINSCQDAYRVCIEAYAEQTARKEDALKYVKAYLKSPQNLIAHHHQVREIVAVRAEAAYAAATLLLAGEQSEIPLAIQTLNWLTSQFGKEDRLYSTLDSAAAIAAMTAVQKTGLVVTGLGDWVKINDQKMRLSQAISFDGKIDKVEAVEGMVVVEIHCQHQEDWSNLRNSISQRIEYFLERNGNLVNLKVVLEEYEPGLLLHYQLPPCLRRNLFGGKVSGETIDFKGGKEINISLGINGKISDQSWRILVRNMFEEKKVWNPGLLKLEL